MHYFVGGGIVIISGGDEIGMPDGHIEEITIFHFHYSMLDLNRLMQGIKGRIIRLDRDDT